VRWWIALVAVACLARVAAADDRPWAQGVSDSEQKTALALYDEGNKFFEESEYKPALEKYEAALVHWKHPAVYFNAAVCLFNLDQSIKAYDYIERALAYGEAPFDKKLYKQALDYKKLLSAQVTELEVKCTQTAVQVMLDGERLMETCPASATRRVLVAKEHAIVAKKEGYETATIGPIKLAPGEKKTLEIVLKPLARGKVVRRWNKWLPWSVVAAGGVIAVAGIAPALYGRQHIESFDRAISADCVGGCPQGSRKDLEALESKGKTDANIAVGMYITGGVIMAAGFAMAALNQARIEHAPAITPVIGPDHVGATFTATW
jgi:tetratricopeptide (TPR) repeat protein